MTATQHVHVDMVHVDMVQRPQHAVTLDIGFWILYTY